MDTRSGTTTDEKALSALFQSMIDGWNQGDGQAYAAPFTEDADYVIVDGTHIKGRETIASGHQYIFDTVFRGSKMEGHVTDIRFLSANVALLHSFCVLQMPNQVGGITEQPATQTIVAHQQSNGWRFTAFQNTRIEERSRQ
jgi:uncharacterized protein (TIGR02246 family)